MTHFTKAEQLKKNKEPNKKKMSKIEKELYIDFIRDKSGGVCQIPGCTNPAQDFAHRDRAYRRDDRYGALICREHHQIADQPNPKQVDESSKVNLELGKISKQNWIDYGAGF